MRSEGVQRAAVHEAGHATVAFLLGCRVDRAVIFPATGNRWGTGSRGHVLYDDERATADERVMALCAGREAVKLVLGDSDELGCRNDVARALALCDGDQERLDALARRARRLLRLDHARPVQEVAIALLEHCNLSGDEIETAVRAGWK